MVGLDDPLVRGLPLTDARYRPAQPAVPEGFWQRSSDGRLRFYQCPTCRCFVHPLKLRCPACGAPDLVLVPVSGRGTILTCTVNHHKWDPALAVPYIIAIVGLTEGVRLTSNVVGVACTDVRIGLAVRAVIVDADPLWIPVFEPDEP